MRISTIWYTIKQGCKNIIRNRMFSLASIGTMAACIFMFGVFFSVVWNNILNILYRDETIHHHPYIKYIFLKLSIDLFKI